MGLFKSKEEKLYQKGRDELRSGSTEKAMEYLEQAADMGSQNAAFLLGDIYREGVIAPQDGAKAAKMYAKLTIPYGKYALGLLYYYGNGVEKDEEKAFHLFQEAASAKKYGILEAKGYLGAYYFWGRVVKQDYAKTAEYIKYEPDKDPDVAYCYEYLRFHGLGGVPKNQEAAAKKLAEIGERSKNAEIVQACWDMVYEYAGAYDLDNCGGMRSQLMDLLVRASVAGSVGASCKLAEFYLTHTQTQEERRWDEEEQEWVAVKSYVYDLWKDAARCIGKICEGYRHASEEEQRQVMCLFLDYGELIKERSEGDYRLLKTILGLES